MTSLDVRQFVKVINETDKHHRGASLMSELHLQLEKAGFLFVLRVRFNLEIVFKYFFS